MWWTFATIILSSILSQVISFYGQILVNHPKINIQHPCPFVKQATHVSVLLTSLCLATVIFLKLFDQAFLLFLS